MHGGAAGSGNWILYSNKWLQRSDSQNWGERVRQILLNLVNNSLDSMKAKGEGGRRVLDLSTGVILEKGREWAQVSVHDTGEGIDKDELSNVFKPFYTTKRPGEGTGLGLTICHQLVRKYGGVLELDSKKGAWTRVLIKVPYQAEL